MHNHAHQTSKQYGSTVTVSAEHQRLLQLTSAAAVIVAVTLITLKLSAWLMSGSVSLLASLVDSTMDSMVSIINFFLLRKLVFMGTTS